MKKKTFSVILLIVVSIAIVAVAFYSESSQNHRLPYIPQDYSPVKIEYIDAPDEVKFSVTNEWVDFVNSLNLSKIDEQPAEDWVFHLTFGYVFPVEDTPKASKEKRTIDVFVGENTILIDGINYSIPDNKELIDVLVARWNRAPLLG